MHSVIRLLLATAAATVVLAGCAPTPYESPSKDKRTAPPTLVPQPPAAEKVPEQPFSQQQLLSLLTAELASQYGDGAAAADDYRREAETIGSPQLFLAAQLAAEQGRNIAAMEANAALWVERFPDDINARRASMRSAAARGDGERLFNEALALFQTNDNIELLFAAAQYLEHNPALNSGFTKAVARSRDTHRREPLGVQLAVTLLDCQLQARTAVASNERQRLVDCASQISQAAARAGGQLMNTIWRASTQLTVQLLTQLRRHFEAVVVLKQATRRSADAALQFDLARLLLNIDRGSAVKELRGVVALDPGHHQAKLLIALLYLEDNAIAAAEPLLAAIPERSRWYSDAQFQLGRIADVQKKPKRALFHFRHVAPGPNFERAALRTGQLLWALYGEQQFSQWLRSQRRQHADLAEPLYLIELEVTAQHRPTADIALLDRAIDELPASTTLLMRRALLLEQRGAPAQAAADLKLVVAQDPNNAKALNTLGYMKLTQLGLAREGHALIERANALEPDNPAILDSLGWALYKLGDLQGALGKLLRAHSLLDDPEVASHLGEVYWQLNKPDKAVNLWREALQRFPDTHHVRDTIDRLDVDLYGVYE